MLPFQDAAPTPAGLAAYRPLRPERGQLQVRARLGATRTSRAAADIRSATGSSGSLRGPPSASTCRSRTARARRPRANPVRLAGSHAGAHLSRSPRPGPASQGRAPVLLARLPSTRRGDRGRAETRRQRLPVQQHLPTRRPVRHDSPRLHRRLRIRRGPRSGQHLGRGSRPGRPSAPNGLYLLQQLATTYGAASGPRGWMIWFTVSYPAAAPTPDGEERIVAETPPYGGGC